MTTKIDTSADYFCYGYDSTAGRPKMEAALFDYAKQLILHRTISGSDLNDLAAVIMARQDELAEQHHNWRPVEIRYSDGIDGLIWFYIGESYLTLRKILGRFESAVKDGEL